VTRLLAALAALLLAPAAARAAEPPAIAAPAAIAVEATTGDVAFEKDADARRPIASTTKLMTALLVLEAGDLNRVVRAPRYDALPVETVLGLTPGERITRADLLRGLLLVSANDAAVALAQDVGGSVPAFVRMMNRRAVQLGLENTSYANPIGLDEPGNYSSARDLATLALELRKNRFFRHTVNQTTLTLRSGATSRTIDNRNDLLATYPWVEGMKTGTTLQAGYVLVGAGEKRGVHVVSVVLGAQSEAQRDEESLALLNYGFGRYKVKRAVVEEQPYESIPIEHRAGAELPAVAARTIRRVVRRGERFDLEVRAPAQVEGPIDYGDRVGEVVVRLRGERVARVPLVAALEVPAAGFGRRTQDFLSQPWILIVLGAILVVASLVTRQRTASPRRDRPATGQPS
jgi:serine-type D-Ala-D-Ala carboxypeptidase (penicillin-binding protein 5/6)